MYDAHSEATRTNAAEELILRTIAAHAESLLRTARRHSICLDDAQDSYQRSIEIFMAHAHRLDAGRAPGWLHVVVKREAQAIRRTRQKLLASTEVDLDGHESQTLPTPDEQLLSLDMMSRSAEALKRLKPHELRALWLRAQGHSYSDIGAMTGWSYSKVNRCLSEGRRAFLERYAGIETGAECERWQPVLSALVDGEATPHDVLELRPHLRNCPGCRATLRSLRDTSKPLAALLPVPFVVIEGGGADHVAGLLMRLYEGFAGGLHERAVASLTKTQALLEASAAGKVAAVAASAAAVAGGGYASVERIADPPPQVRSSASAHVPQSEPIAKKALPVATRPGGPVIAKAVTAVTPQTTSTTATHSTPRDFGSSAPLSAGASKREFRSAAEAATADDVAASAASFSPPAASSAPARDAPEFASQATAAEFAP